MGVRKTGRRGEGRGELYRMKRLQERERLCIRVKVDVMVVLGLELLQKKA